MFLLDDEILAKGEFVLTDSAAHAFVVGSR
jgi:hypothetical protein